VSDTLTGHAIVFHQQSELLGNFHEVWTSRAVARTFREKIDLRALVGHDPLKVIGRLSARTLRASVTPVGLHVEVDVAPTTYGRDALAVARRGDAPGWSFAFIPLLDEWSMLPDGTALRTMLDARLFEVSAAVTWPAFSATENDTRGLERRAAGYSGGARWATRLWAAGFLKLAQRTADLRVRCAYRADGVLTRNWIQSPARLRTPIRRGAGVRDRLMQMHAQRLRWRRVA
jgi:HK97 family phage prohead protease